MTFFTSRDYGPTKRVRPHTRLLSVLVVLLLGMTGVFLGPQQSASAATITISPASFPVGVAGTYFTAKLSASGGTAPYTFSVTGTLPAGVTFDNILGELSGTPTVVGGFNIIVSVTDSSSDTASQLYTLNVAAPTLGLTPTSPPAGVAGAPYSQTFVTSGGVAPYSYEIASGSLPSGLTLNAATGMLYGTTAVSGSFPFTIGATDSSTGIGAPFSVSRAVTLIMSASSITVTPATLAGARVGVLFSTQLTAAGGTAPYTFVAAAGAPPAGLVLSSSGLLSGTPTAAGSINFTVRAIDNYKYSGMQSYTLVVAPPITVGPATLTDPRVGVLFSTQLTAAGAVGAYTFAVTAGALPAGMTLSASGLLSGVPTQLTSASFTVTATDNSGFTGSEDYVLQPVAAAVSTAAELGYSGADPVPAMSWGALLLVIGAGFTMWPGLRSAWRRRTSRG